VIGLAAVEVVPHVHRQEFIQNILQRGNRFLKQFRQRLTQSLSLRKNIQQIHEPSYEHQHPCAFLRFRNDAGVQSQRENFKAGETAWLKSIGDEKLTVESDGRTVSIPFKQLDKITPCRKKELALSAGDKLQLKANGKSADGRKLANGELVTVKEIRPDGRIALTDGRTLEKNFRQFVRGYAITSYASQGKSVNYVLFSDSAAKAATNNQQWYVTISRGKKGVQIFTTDKAELRENIARSGDRQLAIDIAPVKNEEKETQRVAVQSAELLRQQIRESHKQRQSQSRGIGI
jgi:hypothetical protein